MIRLKQCYFLWQIKHGRLATRSVTGKWNENQDESCTICQEYQEDLVHALRDCTQARLCWSQLVPNHILSDFLKGVGVEWIDLNLRGRDTQGFDRTWPETFATACWYIWRWRNSTVHERDFKMPFNPKRLILQCLENYRKKWDGDVVDGKKMEIIWVSWSPPHQGWCKLNTDGMSKANFIAGCGGMIRGDCGEWLGGFSTRIQYCTSKVAEAKAILEGLQMCWIMGFKKVDVECDAAEIVEDLNQFGKIQGCYNLSMQISQFLQRDWRVRVNHVYRESNRCTDKLAELSMYSYRERTTWTFPPAEVEEILKEDQAGILFSRRILV